MLKLPRPFKFDGSVHARSSLQTLASFDCDQARLGSQRMVAFAEAGLAGPST
jgi:hypothetical protein